MKTNMLKVSVLALLASSLALHAADETVNGNLFVTGMLDLDGNSFSFGTRGTEHGAAFVFTDSSIDTLSFYLNRSPASWLWAYESAQGPVSAMRLAADHKLMLYRLDGVTGISFDPEGGRISFQDIDLYRDGSGALKTDGAFVVGGAFNAANYTASNGVVAGANGLELRAGGADSDVVLNPTGNGSVVIDNSSPFLTFSPNPWAKLAINAGYIAAGDPVILLRADDANSGSPIFSSISFANDLWGGASVGGMEFKSWDEGGTVGHSYVFRGANETTNKDDLFIHQGRLAMGTDQFDSWINIDLGERLTPTNFIRVTQTDLLGEYGVATIGFTDDTLLGGGTALEFAIQGLAIGGGYEYVFRGYQPNRDVRILEGEVSAPKIKVMGDARVQGKIIATSASFSGVVRVAKQGDLEMGDFTQGPGL